jgi:hypothetical protein
MAIRGLSWALILITGGKYAKVSCRVVGDETITSEAKEAIVLYSHTGGPYQIVSPHREILTSGKDMYEERGFSTKNIDKAYTKSGKSISLEEMVVDFVTMVIPEVEHIMTKRQLDIIKERSAEIGAINAHLDSIDVHLAKLNRTFDEAFEKYDAIKARF